nr:polysaccharide pyruvyl transferase family protein [uncultured Draconibacterium sp.]
MKIGIVTLPFNSNYGGILQAYALQSVLKKMGHTVLTVNRFSKSIPVYMKILSFAKRFVERYFLQKKVIVRTWPNKREQDTIAQHTKRFITENIEITEYLKNETGFNKLNRIGFEAYVVGSDQVWRPKYSPSIENHFLAFEQNNSKVKRISYAASFGVDSWEYSPKQTENCRELVQLFSAVSVREKSGISLCKNNLNVDAIQVLDPTLLVDKDEYIGLVKKDNLPERNETLLTYLLDQNSAIQEIVAGAERNLNKKAFSTMPRAFFRNVGAQQLDKCIAPPVTNWIKGFMDADFVITDSFHGTVFSIIFNKPFISIGNTKRGMSRFTSFLEMFDLQDRLLTEKNLDRYEELLNKTVDFDSVNTKLAKLKSQSITFLEEALR